jgi:hypothetical protein
MTSTKLVDALGDAGGDVLRAVAEILGWIQPAAPEAMVPA